MANYELLFVVKPTHTEEEIAEHIANVKASIEKDGGEIAATQDMGMRKLAYEVQKSNRGYYTVFYFSAPTETITEIERLLRINESILKFMTVKYGKNKEITAWETAVKKINNLSQKATEAPAAPAVAPVEPAAETAEA